jgi:hypothetical protein
MIEIFFIFLSFQIFLLTTLVPLKINLSNLSDIKNILDKLIYNLILNLNFLFLLSVLPINIGQYCLLLAILYLLLFFYKYFILNFNIDTIVNLFLFFLIPGFVFTSFAMIIANELNLGWDAKYFYYIKSLFFFDGLSLESLNNFEHNKWHPHLGSFYWGFFWYLSPLKIEYYGRLFYLFIYCIAIFYLTQKIFKKKLIANILFIIISLSLFNYERFSGLQEILIFSLLIIASYFVAYSSTNKKFYILFIILISNLILWIKSEGIVYILIISLCLMLNKSINQKLKFITLISIASIILFKYLIYHKYNFIYNAQPYNMDYLSSLNIKILNDKIKHIVPYLGYYSLKNYIFSFGVIILFYKNIFNKNKIYLLSFNIFAILNILFIFLAYLTREIEILYSIKTTMERVVFTSSGFYLFLILSMINEKIEIKKKWNLY